MLSKVLSFLLVCIIGHVLCQFDGRDRDRERGFDSRERFDNRDNRERERDSPLFRQVPVEECREKVMDIFFILDSSSSIYINDYRGEHTFVREVISRLDVSSVATRVGALTFSDDYQRPALTFSRYQAKNDVLNSINEQNLPYRKGVTNTDQAIRYVRELSEFREDITKVIVVITDGGSRSPGATAREAEMARENGFYLFVVGVGQYLDEREWRAIASDPDDSFLYNITQFRYLDTVQTSLPPRACNLPPLIVGSCRVNQAADIFFLAGPGGFQNAQLLLDELFSKTSDFNNLLRVSILMNNCEETENIPVPTDLGAFCNRFALRGEATPETYLDLMRRMREIARRNREQRNAKQVAVLFIDEETLRLNRFQLVGEARSAEREDGIEIVVVELGVRSSSIASNRDNVIRFSSAPIQNQRQMQRQLISRTCANIPSRPVSGVGEPEISKK